MESQIPIKCNLREKHGADAMIWALTYLSNICAMPIFFASPYKALMIQK